MAEGPYLEPIELDGGGYRQRDVVNACGTSVLRFRGTSSDLRYFKRLYCMKPFCPACNKKRGRLEKKRIGAVLRRLPKGLKGMFLRQWVFTIPESLRNEFKSRDRLNQLTRSVTRIMKQFYPDKGWIDYIHLIGDKGDWHPHVNVHIPERYKHADGTSTGEKWSESPDRIAQIRKRWKMALTGIVGGALDVSEVNVFYSYKKTRAHMLHGIKYMGRADFAYSDEIIDFMAENLKGFQYLRFGGILRNGVYKDGALNKKELEEKAGERLQFEDIVSMRDIDLQYMAGDLEEVSPGLWRETERAYYARTHKKRGG